MHLRRYFGTGLLITLPAFFTLYLIYVVFRFIDGILGKVINFYLKKSLGFSIPGLGIILGVIVVTLIGFIATNYFGKRLFKALENWFLKFPFIRRIYPAAKQIVDSFISKESPAFKKVVLVEYPSKGIWSIGFYTNEGFSEAIAKTGEDLVHIFIATTPSPLTGFLVLVPKNNVKPLDVSIEDGIKMIISGGIVRPEA
jgi:uncharacterized membrane protein